MSEKTAKPKRREEDAGVLGNLPATRPTRFGGERAKAPRRRRTTRATREAEGRRAKPKAAREAQAPPRRARARARPVARPAARPRGRAVARGVDASAPAPKRRAARARTTPPSGTELVTTAIQAAGELAQIGLAVGGQVLKRAVDKLPKP